MDERTFKRLLKIVVVCIIAIVLIKIGLTKTYTTLNKAAAEKKEAVITTPSSTQLTKTLSSASETIETPTASRVDEVTTLDLPAASSASGTR